MSYALAEHDVAQLYHSVKGSPEVNNIVNLKSLKQLPLLCTACVCGLPYSCEERQYCGNVALILLDSLIGAPFTRAPRSSTYMSGSTRGALHESQSRAVSVLPLEKHAVA